MTKRTYDVFSLEGKHLISVEASSISAASECVTTCWPCRIKGEHLSHIEVVVNPKGELSIPDYSSSLEVKRQNHSSKMPE